MSEVDYTKPYYDLMQPGQGSHEFQTREAAELYMRDTRQKFDNGWYVLVRCEPEAIYLMPDCTQVAIGAAQPTTEKPKRQRRRRTQTAPANAANAADGQPAPDAPTSPSNGAGDDMPDFLRRQPT